MRARIAPSRKGREAIALACFSVLLAGCETTPPGTTAYWPESTYLTVVAHRGDTVSGIAQRYNVSKATLKDMNSLSGASAVHPGQLLRLPANSRAIRAAVLKEAKAPQYALWNKPGIAHPTVEVRPLRAPRRERSEVVAVADVPAVVPRPAPREPVADDAATESSLRTASIMSSAGEFEWPVEGRVIDAFGKGGDGTRNDGINIAADVGTPIHAAAGGDVTYVGNALKGYGNLILIRHDNGYVTAYAHAQSIIVARGDRVDRGDVIGYAGNTGGVAVPQLHFEVRRGVKPVDPRPLLIASRES